MEAPAADDEYERDEIGLDVSTRRRGLRGNRGRPPVTPDAGAVDGGRVGVGGEGKTRRLSVPAERWFSGSDVCDWMGVGCDDEGGRGNTTEVATAAAVKVLVELRLTGRDLTGTIPPEIGLLRSLTYLNLSDNVLGGSLPDEIFYGCQDLRVLMLDHNRLTGTLGDDVGLGKLSRLEKLYLGDNLLDGTLPGMGLNSLGRLSEFYSLSLSLSLSLPSFALMLPSFAQPR